MKRVLLAALFWLSIGVPALAETQSVIDPTDGAEPSKPPAAEKRPVQSDAALKRARLRAEAEERRRARAEARALAAEQESARLRALEQARQAQAAAAAREAAAKATARKAAAARAATRAAAAKATQALIEAETEAARRDAKSREAAARELAAREAAAREAARQAAVKELAAKEAAGKEIAAREMAARDAAVRDAREAAARLIASREAAEREARGAGVRFAATREHPLLKESRATRPAPSGAVFRDCGDCPELVWLPQGEFVMGDAMAAVGSRPVVAMKHPLAVGRFEITFAEWDVCVAASGCKRRPHDAGWGRGGQPVVNVSWQDAQQYVAWLSRRTGKRYRLLTEAEWEYAARAGTDARYWWGNHAGRGEANCADCGSPWDGRQAAPVGRFAPNPFGLYDMNGNVSEWVEDSQGSDTRIVRGGAWHGSTRSMRSTSRTTAVLDYFDNRIGLRVARTD